MRVLVTGGTGLVGSHILRKLVNDDTIEIVATKRSTSKTDLVEDIADQIQWHECDVLDLVQLLEITKGVDLIIHAAALISFFNRDKKQLFDINVGGTTHIVDCCIANNVKKLIYISSVSALGAARTKPLTEDDIWMDKPLQSNYGYSKYLAEQQVWRGQAEGLNVAIVAPSIVIGAGYWDTEPAFIKNIAQGFKYYPTGSNGLVDARDIADMTKLLVHGDVWGAKFICSAANISIKDLITLIAQLSELQLSFKPLSGWLYRSAMFLLKMASLFGINTKMSAESLRIAQENLVFDNSKSLEQLDFHYRSIEETLRHTINLYQTSVAEGKNFGVSPRF